MRAFSPDYPAQTTPLTRGACLVLQSIIMTAAGGLVFTADTIAVDLEKRGLVRGKDYQTSDVGAAFRYAAETVLEEVGFTRSQRPETHHRTIREWRLRGSKTGSPASGEPPVRVDKSSSTEQTELVSGALDAEK